MVSSEHLGRYFYKAVFSLFFKHIYTKIKFTWTLLQARCGAHIGSMTAQKQRGIQGNYWTMYPCTTHINNKEHMPHAETYAPVKPCR